MSTRPASRQRRPQRRFARAAEILPRATEFTDDPQLCDPVWVVTQIQNYPDILDDLAEATSFESTRGRNRVPGKWCLIMLAMTLSGEVDVQTFRNRYAQSPIWQLAGFPYVPTAQTCWNRLTELEPAHQAFEEAANKLIARAVEAEPRIARDVWDDATGFETNAVLEHCCEDREACRARSKASGRGKPPPRYLDRAGNELIKDTRHDEAKESPDTEGDSKPLPAVHQEDSRVNVRSGASARIATSSTGPPTIVTCTARWTPTQARASTRVPSAEGASGWAASTRQRCRSTWGRHWQ